MERPQDLADQITANYERLSADTEFVGGGKLWLTFYLYGDPRGLKVVAQKLATKGWVNVSGSDSAFIYPKTESAKSASAIIETATGVRKLCAGYGVRIINIDADTRTDERSHFAPLYREPD